MGSRVPAYGVMMMAGLVVAGSVGMARVRRAGLRVESAIVVLACAFGLALLGAMGLYLAVTYPVQEILRMVRSGELFTENKMGMVYYGGLLGAIPGAWLGMRLSGARPSDYIPPMVPCIPLGHAFGRIGCLLAGCCYGAPTELPIGVVYQESYSGVPVGVPLLPVQMMESVALIAIFGILSAYARRTRPAARVISLYLMLYAPCRFMLEWLRYDAIRGMFGIFSTSQWISLALFLTGIALWRRTKDRSLCP